MSLRSSNSSIKVSGGVGSGNVSLEFCIWGALKKVYSNDPTHEKEVSKVRIQVAVNGMSQTQFVNFQQLFVRIEIGEGLCLFLLLFWFMLILK